jgi:hypothetical protein
VTLSAAARGRWPAEGSTLPRRMPVEGALLPRRAAAIQAPLPLALPRGAVGRSDQPGGRAMTVMAAVTANLS